MAIAKSINIMGHIFKVEFRQRAKKDGSDHPGSVNFSEQRIWLEEDTHLQEKESSFLHEILETINAYQKLGLKHNTISLLEIGLYQVLKENKIF